MASPFTFILGITSSTQLADKLPSIDKAENIEVCGNNSENNKTIARSSLNKKLTIRAINYLTFNAKVAFTQFKNVFIKASIFCDFDLKCHIQIERIIFGYIFGKILSQLTLDNLS